MSEGRPSLKLTFGKKKASEDPPPPQSQPPPPPAAPTPSASSDTPQRKLTLKIARKPTANGEGDMDSKDKDKDKDKEKDKPKKKKPTKKRPAEDAAAAAAANDFAAAATSQTQSGPKRLKLLPSKKGVQSIRIKNKGLVPTRPVGVGYDSEASDTEADPAIEEQFILRMPPGEDCEYLRRAITERRFDNSEFSFKPLNREGRRAIFKIRDKQYAAALVDLPCIVEGMKSWDRRGWYKSADICQMLLVLGVVSSDKEALEYPLPPDVERPDDKTLQYPHGLTPPLQHVRKRRFRERVSTRTIEQVEKAVEDLIAQDDASFGISRFELIDSTSLNRAEGLVQSGDYEMDEYEYDDEQDAEGEVDEGMEDGLFGDDMEDALAAEMEAALAAGDEVPAAMPAPSDGAADSGVYQAGGGTPQAKPATPAGESSGDDSEGSDREDGGEDVPEEELDDEQLEQQQQLQQNREEIAELEELIRVQTTKWESMQNYILKGKIAKQIQDLKRDLSLKKVSIGEGNDVDG